MQIGVSIEMWTIDILKYKKKRPAGRAVTRSSQELEVKKFKSQTNQIGHSVANGSPLLRHFFKKGYVTRAQ